MDEQRTALVELLDFDNSDHLDMIFKSAEHMPIIEVSRQEREQVKAFLKECDLLMVRLALALHASREAENPGIADEILLTITGMWNDISMVLAAPTIDTVHKTDTHDNLSNIKKLVEKLSYLKPHLSHVAEDVPSQKAKKQRTETNVSTANRFDALSEPQPSTSQEMTEAEEVEMEAAGSNPVQPKKVHVDPIFILINGDWPAYIRHLNKNILSTPIKAKLSGEYMKISPATPEDYRRLTKHLIETNMPFHALMPKAERPAKVLLRGLPSFIKPETIIADLVAMGYTPMHVSVLKKRGPAKDPLPLFLVTLKTTEGWQKIYEETTILETAVVFKSFRSTGTKQCYRCQGFGHSSHNCYMPAKCMKCGQGHESRTCTKPKSEKAKCANCGGAHTANWSGCAANPKNLKSTKKPVNPYSYQAYLNFMRNGPPKVHVDAPLPENPAWINRNPKIYQPPTQNNVNYPKLPSTHARSGEHSSAEEEDPSPAVADDFSARAPSHRKRAAEKRAAAKAASDAKSEKLRVQHAEITEASSGNNALSGFAEAMKTLREFNEIVNLPLLIQKLKGIVQAIKEAPTDMDRAYIVLERLQGLSEVFYNSS